MNYQLRELADIVGGLFIGMDHLVSHIFTDSRTIRDPQDGLFIAINGPQHDGHEFVLKAQRMGVSCFIVEREEAIPDSCSAIVVQNSLQALQEIARHHRSRFLFPLVAITGSGGKTTFKECAFKALSPFSAVIRSPRSYNSQVGVPLSIAGMNHEHDLAIMEAGISQVGEMQKLQKMLNPDIGVFTGLGDAHDSGFENRAEKLHEKLLLFSKCARLIYCRDDMFVHQAILQSIDEECLFSWGRSPEADLRILSYEVKEKMAHLRYCIGGKTDCIEFKVADEFRLNHVMQLIALMHLLGHSNARIKAQVPMSLVTGTSLEMGECRFGAVLISDMSPQDGPSMNTALDSLNLQASTRDTSLILTADPESIMENDLRIAEVKRSILDEEIEDVHLVGSGLLSLSKQLPSAHFHENTKHFLSGGLEERFAQRIILLKGVWSPSFSEIKNTLLASGHQTVMTIDLEAMVHNLNTFRKRLKPGVKTMAMVKAFSYGSGDSEVAQLLAYHRVDMLAVAYADEGVTLRKKGIDLPIMVLNWGEGDITNLLRNRLEPEVYSKKAFVLLLEKLRQQEYSSFPIHLKMDTGMNRLGMSGKEVFEIWMACQEEKEIEVKSVFTHLLASDDPAKDDISTMQLSDFGALKTRIREAGGEQVLFHALNTAGILRFEDDQHDMVRLGIGLYGHSPVSQVRLSPVVGLETRITQIKLVKKGESIGYGGDMQTQEEKQIAILPIGYADGISRRLGKGIGSVFIHGKEARFIGNICMDMSMVDISGLTCTEGDLVELIGPNKSLNTLAEEMGTISYEVLTSISPRVKRLYLNA